MVVWQSGFVCAMLNCAKKMKFLTPSGFASFEIMRAKVLPSDLSGEASSYICDETASVLFFRHTEGFR